MLRFSSSCWSSTPLTPFPPSPLLPAGTALVLGLNLLQVHRRDPEGVWLAVLLLAAAATAIGLLYPLALGQASAPDVSTVMRCLAVFVGIYQATTVSYTSTP